MAVTVQTSDYTTHPIFGLLTLSDGHKVKYPKTQPTGWASAAAWRTAFEVEVVAAVNQQLNGNSKNATSLLMHLA